MFPSRLAFGFLEDIAKEFWKQNSSEIPTVVRPYSFIEFGKLLKEPFPVNQDRILLYFSVKLLAMFCR